MRWTPGGPSADLEDDRGSSGGGGGGFGGRHLGIGGFIVLLLLSLVFHRNFFALLGGGGAPAGAPAGQAAPANSSPEEDKEVQFVSFVLDDVQKTWEQVFAQNGQHYRHAKLVLFRDAVRSGCGIAETAMGPFYCPADEKVYIDLGFYKELQATASAPRATSRRPTSSPTSSATTCRTCSGSAARCERAQRQDPGQANALSVRLELQADCLAGVWGHSTQQRNILEAGDVDEALNAASAVGDDRIQKQATGTREPRDLDPRLRRSSARNGSRPASNRALDPELRHVQQPE